jgi:hypothetical protein
MDATKLAAHSASQRHAEGRVRCIRGDSRRARFGPVPAPVQTRADGPPDRCTVTYRRDDNLFRRELIDGFFSVDDK